MRVRASKGGWAGELREGGASHYLSVAPAEVLWLHLSSEGWERGTLPTLHAQMAPNPLIFCFVQRMADAAGAPVPAEVQAGVAAAAQLAAYDFGGGTMRLPVSAAPEIQPHLA